MRRMRKEIGMPQEELASALGTTQRHISEIENGKAAVSWTLMLAFSTFLVQFPELWQVEEETMANQNPTVAQEPEGEQDSEGEQNPEEIAENPADGVRVLHIMMTSLKSGL